MQETTVVNVHRDAYDIYIGRPGKGQNGEFGNPFNGLDRQENIKKFKDYFYARLKSDPVFFRKVRALRGKRLGCFCRPSKPCHGDIIADYLNSIKPMVYGVVGSRGFHDYEFMKSVLQWFEFKGIVSGGAPGADRLAERYAKEINLEPKVFHADWAKYGRRAGIIRNHQVIENSDEIIAFWDGHSPGTRHTITLANEAGKEVYVFYPRELDVADIC